MSNTPRRDTHGEGPAAGPKERFGHQGIRRDLRGEEQPADKSRAQTAGEDAQREAARDQPPSPGQPARGE